MYAGFRQFVQDHERAFIRLAYLLTGDVVEAQHLLVRVMGQAGLDWRNQIRGNPVAHVHRTFYRQYLSRWGRRFEPVPAIGQLEGLLRVERATVIARFHDGLLEWQAADLCDCPVEVVRTLADTADVRAALRDLADQAPLTDLADASLAATLQRRRRGRLLMWSAIGAAILLVAPLALIPIGLFFGAPFFPGGPPFEEEQVPGPLPAKGVAAARYAYQSSECLEPPPDIESDQDPCYEWRVLTTTGKRWRIPDSAGGQSFIPGLSEPSPPIALTADGRRVAYYRMSDRRFVARDLMSGTTTMISPPVDGSVIADGKARVTASQDGRWFAVEFPSEKGPQRTVIADFGTGQITDLPVCCVIGLGLDGSTVAVAMEKTVNDVPGHAAITELSILGPDREPRSGLRLDDELVDGTAHLGPDNRTLAFVASGHNEIVTMDVVTGKVLKRIPFSAGPRGRLMRFVRWISPSDVLISGGDREQEFAPPANDFYAVNLTTGRARELASGSSNSYYVMVVPGALS